METLVPTMEQTRGTRTKAASPLPNWALLVDICICLV